MCAAFPPPRSPPSGNAPWPKPSGSLGSSLAMKPRHQNPTAFPAPRDAALPLALTALIGRWSMLDVFLVAFLSGIVRFGALASIRAQPGAVAFGAVVILTMLATAAYHPPAAGDAPGSARP